MPCVPMAMDLEGPPIFKRVFNNTESLLAADHALQAGGRAPSWSHGLLNIEPFVVCNRYGKPCDHVHCDHVCRMSGPICRRAVAQITIWILRRR